MTTIYHSTARRPELRELPEPIAGTWIHVEEPLEADLFDLAKDLNLDIDLLKDGIDQNESPRIEKLDADTYIYTRYSLPESEKRTTSPLLIVLTNQHVITVTGKPFDDLSQLFSRQIITSKRARLVMELMSVINNNYKKRINRISRRIWEIRGQLDKAHIDNKDFVTFIDIEEDLNDFLLALEPMNSTLNAIMTGKYFKLYDDDRELIEDLELSTEELYGLAKSRLKTIQNIREAYATMTANNLNKVFKLMTSITILMSIFTIITGVYSMNIALPLAHQPYVFWVILGFSGALIGSLALVFWRKRWL